MKSNGKADVKSTSTPPDARNYPDKTSITHPKNTIGYFQWRFFNHNLIIIVVIVIIAYAFFAVLTAPFKSVSYDNNQGASFVIKFYKKYYTSTDYTSTRHAKLGKIASGGAPLVALAEDKSQGNKYPLWFSISADKINPSDSAKKTNKNHASSSCSSNSKVLTVRNRNINEDIDLCKTSFSKDRDYYIANFAYKNYSYSIIVTQIASRRDALDKKNAQKIDMSAFNSDLRVIIGSIKPNQ